MEKIKFIKKLILEFENDSQVNKFIVYLAKTFLKYIVTYVIYIISFVIWFPLIAFFIEDEKFWFISTIFMYIFLFVWIYFIPSIIFILLFSKQKLTNHTFIIGIINVILFVIICNLWFLLPYIIIIYIITFLILISCHFVLLKLSKSFF